MQRVIDDHQQPRRMHNGTHGLEVTALDHKSMAGQDLHGDPLATYIPKAIGQLRGAPLVGPQASESSNQLKRPFSSRDMAFVDP